MAKPKRGSLFGAPAAPEREESVPTPPAPAPGSRAATRAPSREGKRAVTFYVDPTAAKQLSRLSVDEDTSVQALMVEALNDLFAKRGLHRIA